MDATGLGARVARLRRDRGWTQAELAAALPLSDSYVSMIETGARAPSATVLQRLAEQLGCSTDYLRAGAGPPEQARALTLELKFAELALRAGDAPTAATQFEEALARARTCGDAGDAAVALFGLSRAREALGDLHAAAAGFQQLADDPDLPAPVAAIDVRIWLTRTYMAAGSMSLAAEVGEAALREARRAGPVTDRTVELAATVVLCHYERGDLLRAETLIADATQMAETLGSAQGRGSAYWNAALVAEAAGDVAGAERLTERALALFAELDNRWAIAMLRRNRAWLLLQADRPKHAEARPLLERALADLEELGNPGEAAEAEADLARCDLRAGEIDSAIHRARAAVDRARNGSAIEAAKVTAVLAEILLAAGETDEAYRHYRAAAETLHHIGATRHAANAYHQLAAALTAAGRTAEAAHVYEQMASAAGLTPVTPPAPGSGLAAAAERSRRRRGGAVGQDGGGAGPHDAERGNRTQDERNDTSHDDSPLSRPDPLRVIAGGHAPTSETDPTATMPRAGSPERA